MKARKKLLSRRELVAWNIRNGLELNEPMVSVQTAFDYFNMGMYAKWCCRKIIESGLIDSRHITINSTSAEDVAMDKFGLAKCSSILTAYISNKEFDELSDLILQQSLAHEECNNEIRYFRNMDKKKLKKELNSTQKFLEENQRKIMEKKEKEGVEEAINTLIIYIKTELKSRGLLRIVRSFCWKIMKKYIWQSIDFQFYGLVKTSNQEQRKENELECENAKKIAVTKSQLYELVYKRFKSGSIKRKKTDEIIRFLYIAVKYIGMNKVSIEQRNSPFFIENQNREFDEIFELMGKLSPEIYMRTFPIDKDFSNDKGWKNYFDVKEFVDKFDVNKPIGSMETARYFTYSYLNQDMQKFVVKWLMHCNDMRKLFGIDPYEEMINYGFKKEKK